MARVFLSHDTADTSFARRLGGDLRSSGHDVWMAVDAVRPGDHWVQAIDHALASADVIVVLVTATALRSRWVRKEVDVAIMRAIEGSALFVPVQIELCETPHTWRSFHGISFLDSYAQGIASLQQRLGPAPVLTWGAAAAAPAPGKSKRDEAKAMPVEPALSRRDQCPECGGILQYSHFDDRYNCHRCAYRCDTLEDEESY